MKKISILIFFLSLYNISFAQSVSGFVYELKGNKKKTPLPGVNVYWCHLLQGTSTDTTGFFELERPKEIGHKLVVSFVGYANDTIDVNEFQNSIEIVLNSTINLDEYVVEVREMTTKISTLKAINVETIGVGELKKAACCNLSESFESNASVDVVFADAVTGARTIQMLGLSGVYTQLLSENVPMTRGLSANYGLQYIPGTWVESIQITKGVGSVVNGYEAMSGQINVEFQKPENEKTERLFVNLYGNTMSRAEANVHWKAVLNEKVSTMLFLHGSGNFQSDDINNDGFMNFPITKQLNVMNRWKIQSKKTEQVFSIRGVYDDRISGDMRFTSDQKGSQSIWGSEIKTRILEGYAKNGFLFPNSKTASLGIIASGKHHKQESYFGLRDYNAEQNSAYLNVIYNDVFGNTNHAYKAGLSYIYDRFAETYRDSTFGSEVNVPGAFFEYTYTHLANFTFLAGFRSDYHNRFGMKYTPRVHLRYQPLEKITLRASAGTGFRTAHTIMENTSTLVSNRKVVFRSDLNYEESFNAGGSLTWEFKLLKKDGVFNLDYYYTSFTHQVVIDFDQNVNELYLYNLDGKSFSHSVQADLDVELLKGLTAKFAYKHYLVKQQYASGLLDKPFVPRDRAMFNLSYQTNNKKWKFDWISNWFGSTRIPISSSNPEVEVMPKRSQDYFILHAQITKVFRKFDWYLGAENLLNFTQTNAIISANDAFGPNFDASMIWGPLSGRVVYSGIRLTIR